MASAASPTDQAIQLLCAKNFHQSLWLPATSSHPSLRVTFATSSNFANVNLPVVLFCGPMFGTRWLAVDCDHLATRKGVRLICVDRPGMGGSTPVTLALRVAVWLETVPALLAKLAVPHVTLMSHSAGTIYLLNTLARLRGILNPVHPLVAMMSPYVHNEHSRATLMQLAARLPEMVVRAWEPLIRFVNRRVMPVTAWSGGVLGDASAMFGAADAEAQISVGERYGVSEEVGKEVEKLLVPSYLMAEDTSAVNEEALLCLKKAEVPLWGAAEDYAEFVRQLVKLEGERSGRHVKVQAYFAETDVMIGKGGQRYFDECWRQEGVEGVVEYESVELKGTNHDSTLIDQRNGGLGRIFDTIVGGSG